MGSPFNVYCHVGRKELISYCALVFLRQTLLSALECMAGTTRLELATSAVTAKRKRVTYRKQEERMAHFSSLRHPW